VQNNTHSQKHIRTANLIATGQVYQVHQWSVKGLQNLFTEAVFSKGRISR